MYRFVIYYRAGKTGLAALISGHFRTWEEARDGAEEVVFALGHRARSRHVECRAAGRGCVEWARCDADPEAATDPTPRRLVEADTGELALEFFGY
jgi:hypothetical protein